MKPLRGFKAPKTSLGNLDADAAANLIAAAADVSLVIDAEGVIRDLAFNNEELPRELDGARRWVGRPWLSTVTIESRPKVEALLQEALGRDTPRWRHINHPATDGGPDVPILYSAVQVGEDGRIVAFGRDLRPISVLQQRLVDAQQSLERDYSRLRHVETRYRLLFEMSSEAMLVLDAGTQKIVEANPASKTLFGEQARRLVGRSLYDLLAPDATGPVRTLLAAVQTTGRADYVRARLPEGREVVIDISLFRQEDAPLLFVRIASEITSQAPAVSRIEDKLLKVVARAPDGFVLTDASGHVMAANAAFLDMAQLAAEEQTRGETLERWLGRPGVDLGVLIANLRQRGSVRLFATSVRGEQGASTEVEISAVAVMNGDQQCFGFQIRNVARRLSAEGRGTKAGRELPRSVEQLTELIGRVSLKDLVREATDVIERLCIEAALELTGDNRASAAEMLGLSRQSLYVKLRRYGLGDLAEGGADS